MESVSLGLLGLLLNIVGAVFGSGLAYGLLRGEIRRLHGEVEQVKDAAGRAHARLDSLMLTGRIGTRQTDGELL